MLLETCKLFIAIFKTKIQSFVKRSQTTFVGLYHGVVFEHKGHIGEVVASVLIITKPPLIRDIPR